ncbi:hypothetical protein RFI_08898 [Reticulomyxa filosa]|uniref:Uncharacterized protein n=1 Tax=Reticulomyxa filosa TaxID=46433 RepID=X6NSB6_RETFI|nr:hypothetical protein RFI_08898 [Reticulomyxa filosa]|eukprot:ETO28232.1 hypothetical protein RFI_08898 [Reticulomyxa filosa]
MKKFVGEINKFDYQKLKHSVTQVRTRDGRVYNESWTNESKTESKEENKSSEATWKRDSAAAMALSGPVLMVSDRIPFCYNAQQQIWDAVQIRPNVRKDPSTSNLSNVSANTDKDKSRHSSTSFVPFVISKELSIATVCFAPTRQSTEKEKEDKVPKQFKEMMEWLKVQQPSVMLFLYLENDKIFEYLMKECLWIGKKYVCSDNHNGFNSKQWKCVVFSSLYVDKLQVSKLYSNKHLLSRGSNNSENGSLFKRGNGSTANKDDVIYDTAWFISLHVNTIHSDEPLIISLIQHNRVDSFFQQVQLTQAFQYIDSITKSTDTNASKFVPFSICC